MSLGNLLNPDGLLVDPPAAGDEFLGKVLDVDGGKLTIESNDLDGGAEQHAARGHWPDATPGDPVFLRVLPDGGFWAIGWEPA